MLQHKTATEIIKATTKRIENREVFVTYDDLLIPVSFERKMQDLEDELGLLKKEIREIKKSEVTLLIRTINDNMAEIEIKRFIKLKKKEGISSIDDFEIMERLKLPIEQIDKVLEKFERTGIIRERR